MRFRPPRQGGAPRALGTSPDTLTVAAAAAAGFALAVALERTLQALFVRAAGGRVTFVSSVALEGRWQGVGPWPRVVAAMGAAGASMLAAGACWWGIGRVRSGAARLLLWWVASVSALLAGAQLAVGPVLDEYGYGHPLLNRLDLGAAGTLAVVASGFALTWVAFRVTASGLGRALGAGSRVDRLSRAEVVTRVGWLTGAGVLGLAALLGPELTSPVRLAVGVSLVATVLVFPASRRLREQPTAGSDPPVRVVRSNALVAAALVIVAGFVAFFGPGRPL